MIMNRKKKSSRLSRWVVKSLVGVFVALAFVGLLAVNSSAQEMATIQATATVISGLSVNGNNNLIFGNVSPGVAATVDKTTVGLAGSWGIAGTPNAEVQLTFTLPDSLQHVTDPVGIPITFAPTDGSYEDGNGGGQTAPAGALDPNLGATLRLGTAGTLNIWLGGTIFPSIIQTGGDYAADITLDVIYTGG